MINLLPPEIKKQQYFAKLNTGIRHYVLIAMIGGILLSATTLIGNLYTKTFTDEVEAQIASKQKEVVAFKKTETKAKDINEQLKKFAAITEQTTRYSSVLKDISNNLPPNTKITGIQFDGKADSTLKITVIANTRESALSVQPTLDKLDRFSFLDIQEFRIYGDVYQIDLALAFKDDTAARR